MIKNKAVIIIVHTIAFIGHISMFLALVAMLVKVGIRFFSWGY